MALVAGGLGHVYDAGTAFARRALEGVSVEVATGELVLVVGPTGSGKSTLLRVLSTLLPPTEGSLAVDGETVTADSARGMRGRIGLVFQDPSVQLFAETVLADVAFGPRNLGADDAAAELRARDALERVGLDPGEFGPRSPFTLSGGEARRAAIAGVLAMRPAYLLLDEPTAGLDASGRSAVLEAVRRAREGAGVAAVTHDPEELLPLADRVLVLADGRTCFWGTVPQLFEEAHVLDAAGLRSPDVVRVQAMASARGARIARPYALEPREAARRLARAGGWAT